MYDYAVVGGGILGVATARELLLREPSARLVLLEKESTMAAHQTGHNSGVIHAGIYYAPGSAKARLAVAGARSMLKFCRENDIAHSVCGKVIVAVDETELPALRELQRRAAANGIRSQLVGPDAVRELEPNVRCVAGIVSPETGTADFLKVTDRLAELAVDLGAEIRLDNEVTAVDTRAQAVTITTESAELTARTLINCAGLQSDRVARLTGDVPGLRIVPFRGEYLTLKPRAAALVNALIYPVPDPEFPFLGVHFTRMLDGSVHAGPNAVLATSREGYKKRDFRARDAVDALCYRGFWRLAAKHARPGIAEIHRSFSKRAFVTSLQRLIPEITLDDIADGGSGVRAQALLPDGSLADDFVFRTSDRCVHVLNAPSPAATASLEIAKVIADRAQSVS